VRLVDDLASEDRVSVLRVHLHTFEGHSVPVAQLASDHYAVDLPSALAHLLSPAALPSYSLSVSIVHSMMAYLPPPAHFP
jgi:hypothetical protein